MENYNRYRYNYIIIYQWATSHSYVKLPEGNAWKFRSRGRSWWRAASSLLGPCQTPQCLYLPRWSQTSSGWRRHIYSKSKQKVSDDKCTRSCLGFAAVRRVFNDFHWLQPTGLLTCGGCQATAVESCHFGMKWCFPRKLRKLLSHSQSCCCRTCAPHQPSQSHSPPPHPTAEFFSTPQRCRKIGGPLNKYLQHRLEVNPSHMMYLSNIHKQLMCSSFAS